MIYPQNKDEECFKCAVIAALRHKEIKKDHERTLKLERYHERTLKLECYEGLEFPVSINKIDKFEKNDPDTAVNVLFNMKKSIHTSRRSELNGDCSKQVNLLMIVYGENRHYKAT